MGTLAAATILGVAAYSGAIEWFAPDVTTFQNQWVRNYAVAERYLYADPPLPAHVIVGSSMSARLVDAQLGPSTFNLSFGGGSSLTGLQIIHRSGTRPALVVVEANLAERAPDPDMIDRLFVPVVWKLKRHVKAVQYAYQPMNLLLTAVSALNARSSPPQSNDRPDPKTLATQLAQHTQSNRAPLGEPALEDLVRLQQLVRALQQSGSRVVLFEMPMHQDLWASARSQDRRQHLQRLVPDVTFYRLAPSDLSHYQTSDGIHLMPNSARAFSEQLAQWIEQHARP